MHRIACLLALFLGLGAPVHAASVAFDTLTGQSLSRTVFANVTPSNQWGVRFVSGLSGDVASVTVPVALRGFGFEPAEMVYTFHEDGGTAPGAQIGNSQSVRTSALPATPNVITTDGWSDIALTQGATYWLVVALSDTSAADGHWIRRSNPYTDSTTSHFSSDSGQSWAARPNDAFAARVEVVEDIAAVVPLPATLPLVLTALGGGLVLRLRRKTS